MKSTLIAIALTGFVTACTLPPNTSPAVANAANTAGQLFCAIQTNGGGMIVAGLIDAWASAQLGPAAPIAVIATGASKADVDALCAQAAKNTGGTGGIPVSPPANPAAAPMVAVTAPVAMRKRG